MVDFDHRQKRSPTPVLRRSCINRIRKDSKSKDKGNTDRDSNNTDRDSKHCTCKYLRSSVCRCSVHFFEIAPVEYIAQIRSMLIEKQRQANGSLASKIKKKIR